MNERASHEGPEAKLTDKLPDLGITESLSIK